MAGIKSIGILTSGGDAPGMNAAIRAVTRSAIYNGFTVKGIMRGFKGLVFNEIVEFKSQSVSNIIQLGGTILKTARSEEFKTVEGRKAAYDNMVAAGIDALVVIGGDGSLTGAGLFGKDGSYVLQLEFRLRLLFFSSTFKMLLLRIVVSRKLLVEPVGCGVNRSSSGAELFDGLCHFCHL